MYSKLTGREFGVKMIDPRPLRLGQLDMRRLRREVEIMQHIDHENIGSSKRQVYSPHEPLHTPVSLIHQVVLNERYSSPSAPPLADPTGGAVGFEDTDYL